MNFFRLRLVPLGCSVRLRLCQLSRCGPLGPFGPRLAHALLPIAGKGGSDWSYAWVPVVGPIIGGVLGAVIFNCCW